MCARQCGVACGGTRAGKLGVECRLLVSLVLRHQKPQGLGLVCCAEAFLFASAVIFRVKTAIASLIQSELLRHNFFNGYEAGLICFAAVSELQESFVLLLAAFCESHNCWQKVLATVRRTNSNGPVFRLFRRKTKDELGSPGRMSIRTYQRLTVALGIVALALGVEALYLFLVVAKLRATEIHTAKAVHAFFEAQDTACKADPRRRSESFSLCSIGSPFIITAILIAHLSSIIRERRRSAMCFLI
jgi:hypothetical protein